MDGGCVCRSAPGRPGRPLPRVVPGAGRQQEVHAAAEARRNERLAMRKSKGAGRPCGSHLQPVTHREGMPTLAPPVRVSHQHSAQYIAAWQCIAYLSWRMTAVTCLFVTLCLTMPSAVIVLLGIHSCKSVLSAQQSLKSMPSRTVRFQLSREVFFISACPASNPISVVSRSKQPLCSTRLHKCASHAAVLQWHCFSSLQA